MAVSLTHSLTEPPAAEPPRHEYGLLRQCVDSAVFLAIAVILFRGFAAEGYMISTGSMAPCLLGYHRQIVCPSCSFAFCRGLQFDEDDAILAAPGEVPDLNSEAEPPVTVCPNCGLEAIDARGVPRNEGDQLLVHKHLYQLRLPRRWEVVVFRHPSDPMQAYVKRVVGLPHEIVEVIDGDVYADGALQRKSLETQRSMRICVYDHDHAPTDLLWCSRWRADEITDWSVSDAGFVHRRDDFSVDAEVSRRTPIDWLTYHHWIRSGGRHRTSVTLPGWPADAPEPVRLDRSLAYDASQQRLECVGVLSATTAGRLRVLSADPHWHSAIDELERRSHESPVVDLYGYNHPDAGPETSPVHDLMLEAVVRHTGGAGHWRVQMSDGLHEFGAVFDLTAGQVLLYADDTVEPLCSAPLPEGAFTEESTVEMSLFDRQILVAINGVPVFEPVPYSAGAAQRQMTSTPVRVGVADLDLHLSHLRLYRDVHYTGRHIPGRDGPTRLGPEEFYMLGDNSPVSLDSRAWSSPAIPRKLLIGKPFAVHLPSRQGEVELAGRSYHIRIPDFSRVRYIR
jgi:signal peptidase I